MLNDMLTKTCQYY